MKLTDLLDGVADDFSEIDPSDLTHELTNNSKLWTKYIILYQREKAVSNQLKAKMKKLYYKKRDYYAGNGTPEEYKAKPFSLKIKTDTGLQKYIEGDDDIIILQEKIDIQDQKMELLSATLDEVKRRSFAINKIVDYERFIGGG